MTRSARALVTIKITNLNRDFLINAESAQVLARSIARGIKPPKKQIDIIFLDSRRIRKLNARFRGSRRATDVLSFDLGQVANIFISLDAAGSNAKRFRTSFEREVVLYMIHGVLHLARYDDDTVLAAARMRRREERLLRKICGKIDLSKVLTRR